jgi:hypothetical protein
MPPRFGLATTRPARRSSIVWQQLEVIEQITYLLFLKRLDDLKLLEENKAARLKEPIARRLLPEGKDGIGKNGGRSYDDLRWSRFKQFAVGDVQRRRRARLPLPPYPRR